MNGYLTGIELVQEEVPEHLQALQEGIRKEVIQIEDDAEYAEVAFNLMKVGEGDKEAMKEVVAYIQKQHRALKHANESRERFLRLVSSWMYWAKNWTVRKGA